MDVLYSLRSRSDSCDSFAVVSVSDGSSPRSSDQGEYEFDFESESSADDEEEEEQSDANNGDEWEDVGDDDNSTETEEEEYESSSTLMEPHVQLHHQYFKAEAKANESTNSVVPDGPECESDPEPMEEYEAVITEPPSLVFSSRSPIITSPTVAANRSPQTIVPLSPSSKSRNAKEALKAFYLSKAKQTEETLKLIVVRPPPPPPPQTVILPLKAPVRYSVAVQEEAIQTENAQKAQAALQQFYLARELAKKTRAALNQYAVIWTCQPNGTGICNLIVLKLVRCFIQLERSQAGPVPERTGRTAYFNGTDPHVGDHAARADQVGDLGSAGFSTGSSTD